MIEIFGKPNCPNCKRAVEVVRKYNEPYEYKNIEYKMYLLELSEKLGKLPDRVPYIFMDDFEIKSVNELEQKLRFTN